MTGKYERIGRAEQNRFHLVQALADAIAYRRDRIASPCPECGLGATGQRCVDHACDLDLITAYERTAQAAVRAAARIPARRRAAAQITQR